MFAFKTPLVLESFPLSQYPNGVYPSDEDVAELVDIMDTFRFELLTATPQDMYGIFWINCTCDAVKWRGLLKDDSRAGARSVPTAWIDFDDVGCGRVGGATPAGLHQIMFEQAFHSQIVIEYLFMALQWERDRVRNGERPGIHLEQISRYVIAAVDYIKKICKYGEFDGGDDEEDNGAGTATKSSRAVKRGTLLLPGLSPIHETPHHIYATDEDVAAAHAMIADLEASLLAAPDDSFDIYWIHCGHDKITWGGIESGVTEDKGPPPPKAWIDFDDMCCGQGWAATPRELHRMIFSVPHSEIIKTHLLYAQLWENDRVKNGEQEDVHEPSISDNVIAAVDGIEESFRMIETLRELPKSTPL